MVVLAAATSLAGPSASATPAHSLANYHILEEIFRSANGAIYKVRRKSDRRLLVLKERKYAELGRKRDIMNEVTLLESLDHRNVIKCEGHFWEHTRGSLFMVIEWAPGGDLYQRLLRRRVGRSYLPEQWIWRTFHHICLGLKCVCIDTAKNKKTKTKTKTKKRRPPLTPHPPPPGTSTPAASSTATSSR